MDTFIMLTRLAPTAARSPKALEELERRVMQRIRESCPGVEWLGSYAVLGPCDYVDISKARDLDTASKVSALVRTYGHAHTEVWAATEWSHFKEVERSIEAPAASHAP
ncbi:MAG: GYD domain-containing protein [Acidobacteriota bacterium]